MWTIRYPPKTDEELLELIQAGACTAVAYTASGLTVGDDNPHTQRKAFVQNCKNCGAPRERFEVLCSYCKSVQP